MFDFHTHIYDDTRCPMSFLLNVDVQDTGLCGLTSGGGTNGSSLPMGMPADFSCGGVLLSVGLHPWRTEGGWEHWMPRLREWAERNCVVAIGECGLDVMRGASMDVQMEAMRAQVEIAAKVGKPVIVHCVKAMEQLMVLRKEYVVTCNSRGWKPQTWVIHGFRGKPEQAKQLMAKGMRISLGHQYNIDTLRYLFTCGCPFYLETDDCHLPIEEIYRQASIRLGVDVCRLVSRCNPFVDLFRPVTS